MCVHSFGSGAFTKDALPLLGEAPHASAQLDARSGTGTYPEDLLIGPEFMAFCGCGHLNGEHEVLNSTHLPGFIPKKRQTHRSKGHATYNTHLPGGFDASKRKPSNRQQTQ